MLQERRKAVHEQTAQAIEQIYHDRLDEHYSVLAHHYQRSGNIEKAIEFLQKAGQQAVQRSANIEAITHLTAALDLLLTRPETPERTTQELTLRLAMGPPLMAAHGTVALAVEQNYTRARELCAQLDNPSQHVPVLWGLWRFHLMRGELRTTQVLAEKCLQIAEQTSKAELLIEAYYVAGTTFLFRGEFVRAQAALEQSVALSQPQHYTLPSLSGGFNPRVGSLSNAILAWWSLGYPEQALIRSREVLHLARELGQPYGLVLALQYAAGLHLWRGEWHIAQEYAEECVTLSNEHGFPLYLALGTVRRGTTLIAQAQWEEGITQVRQGLKALSGELARSSYLVWLAKGYEGVGQIDEGLAAIGEALQLVEKNDERCYEAEIYRLKGELTLQSSVQGLESRVKKAEECLLKAIEIANRQQAKSLELRAVMSLVRLRQQQATQPRARTTQHETRTNLDTARKMLADVYHWFTEGFDTKDLQEAKALLEKLKG
jgi:tetratricopeptide (TPR) repeat protein